MQTNNLWIYVTIAVIWITVIISSISSPELQINDDPTIFNVAALVDWFWGLLGTVFVMRSTVFRRPHEAGYGQDEAWGFVALAVSGIWIAAMLVSIGAPTVSIGEEILIPAGAIVAPIVAAALTPYACEFLIEGVAARLAGRAGV